MKTPRRPRTLCIAMALAAVLTCTLSCSPATRRSTPPLTAQETALLLRAATAAHAEAVRLAASGNGPTCSPPPLPAAQYPNGTTQGYGVPFVAAIYGVQVLSGYDEFFANHSTVTVGTDPPRVYNVSPWTAHLAGITGWAAGILQLPSLTGTVPPGGVTFCNVASSACLTDNPPAGQCAQVELDKPATPSYQPGQPPLNQPGRPTTNTPMVPVTASGPSTLAAGQSATYQFSVPTMWYHAGIGVIFTGSTGGTAVSGSGGAFYVGPPLDVYPGQGLQLSNVTVNGKPAGASPGPVLPPGSVYTLKFDITNNSPGAVQSVTAWNSQSGYPGGSVSLNPGKTGSLSFTGTVQPGSTAITIQAMGTDLLSGADDSGSAIAYMQGYSGTPPASQLVVSNPTIDGQAATSPPGPNLTDPTYQLSVTVTNRSSSAVSGITGLTPGLPCGETPGCTPYVAQIDPVGTTTLSVTGVDPDGALEVSGTAASIAELGEMLGTTVYSVTEHQPTTVTISSQAPASLPPSAPPVPASGNPDQRGLQVQPEPVTGPLVGGTGVVAGNDFAVPAFYPVDSSGLAYVFETNIAAFFNTQASGFVDPLHPNYPCTSGPPCATIAAQPGWAQFSGTAQITQIGLPSGLPPNFSF